MAHDDETVPRRWIQTAGFPVGREVQAVRDEIDLVTFVEILPGSSRVILYSRDACIGALDLMPEQKGRIDAKVEEPEAAHVPDPAAGDTVIRPLDPTDPEHAAVIAAGGVRMFPEDPGPPPPGIIESGCLATASSIEIPGLGEALRTARAESGEGALATRVNADWLAEERRVYRESGGQWERFLLRRLRELPASVWFTAVAIGLAIAFFSLALPRL